MMYNNQREKSNLQGIMYFSQKSQQVEIKNITIYSILGTCSGTILS